MDAKSNHSQRQVCQVSMHGFKAVLQILRWSRCMSSWTFCKEEREGTIDELGRFHGNPLLDRHCLHPFTSPKPSKADPKPANASHGTKCKPQLHWIALAQTPGPGTLRGQNESQHCIKILLHIYLSKVLQYSTVQYSKKKRLQCVHVPPAVKGEGYEIRDPY